MCLGQSAAKTAKQIVVFVTRKDLWPQRAKWNYNRLKDAIKGEPNKLEKRGLDYYGKLMPSRLPHILLSFIKNRD